MTDRGVYDDAVAEVRRRVERGRSTGLYPADLDAQLESQFMRAGKDPLLFERLDAARAAVDALRSRSFTRAAIPVSSELPGGTALHRLLSKVVGRQVDGVLSQVDEHARQVDAALGATIDAIDELRTVIQNDLFGDIDAVHHRLVSLEHELSLIRQVVQPDSPT